MTKTDTRQGGGWKKIIFFLAFRSFLEFCNFTVWNEGQDPSVAESRIDFIFLEISVKLGECGEIFSLVGSDLP